MKSCVASVGWSQDQRDVGGSERKKGSWKNGGQKERQEKITHGFPSEMIH